MADFLNDCIKTIQTISIADVIDIACVSVLIYFIYMFIRDRRAGKLAIGVGLLIIIKLVCDIFGMYVMQFILQNVFQVGLIIIAIVFQPELRSVLEKVGGQPLKGLKSFGGQKFDEVSRMIDKVVKATVELGESKTGALIVVERLTKLGDMILTGTVIDAEPSVFLIKNIFYNKAPLHDGALIIRGSRLYAAGCLLPLSVNADIIKDLGTRHRAAIGMSENSDAVVIVVSEETGVISLAVEGVLYRGYTDASLRAALEKYLLADPADGKKSKIYRLKSKLYKRSKSENPNKGEGVDNEKK